MQMFKIKKGLFKPTRQGGRTKGAAEPDHKNTLIQKRGYEKQDYDKTVE